MEDAIEQLLDWATGLDIELDGIAPKILPGRGIGVVATRKIKPDEVVLTVPISALRTIANTPRPIIRKLKGATVHAILSASLCLDTTASLATWHAVFPSKDDVLSSMPLCWPDELQELLPSTATILLAKQKTKYDKDWPLVSAAYPKIAQDDFLYAWLLVNTRTFYHTTAKTAKLPKDDHMILQPVADLFNHSADGCAVAYDTESFTITTAHAYEPGEEMFIRYGAHPNDFLLVEYGFVPPGSSNIWDETTLDAYICPLFSKAQRRRLEDAGFWAGYKLDAETACYRTQIALRVLCLEEEQWRAVLDGKRDEDMDQAAVDRELRTVLRKYEKDVRGKMAMIERTKVGEDAMRDTLRVRWVQIKELIMTALSRLEP